MTPTEAMEAKIEVLTYAVQSLCLQLGGRLTRQQFAERMGVHRNTLSNNARARPLYGQAWEGWEVAALRGDGLGDPAPAPGVGASSLTAICSAVGL